MNAAALSRRDFLSRSTRAAGVAMLPFALPARSAPSGFKIGACEWSLRTANPLSFTRAREIGLDGIQLSMGSVASGMHLFKKDVQQTCLDGRLTN